jgi:hypothetical protein
MLVLQQACLSQSVGVREEQIRVVDAAAMRASEARLSMLVMKKSHTEHQRSLAKAFVSDG